ncbi:MAG: Hydroxymethylpyrimidine/phosphomethylpyrimidine kinase [Chlamydiales bacterium]|nr:Hydroxymethylpyrimidine/phosphomethylpyrimidine kinase [Chlamydiales bacterium]
MIPTVLTIAGSDSGGGAGIQADLKAFSDNRCFGTTAITCLTAQNRQQVNSIQEMPADFIVAQIQTVLADFDLRGIKIGMLYSREIIEAVIPCIQHFSPLVIDPVMIAHSGISLLKTNALASLKKLIKHATVITPNLDEASHLIGYKIDSYKQMPKAAQILLEMGPKAVLLKGGHLKQHKGWDYLLCRGHPALWLKKTTLSLPNVHGTGCLYSAALTAFLAQKYSLTQSAKFAKEYLHQFLLSRLIA